MIEDNRNFDLLLLKKALAAGQPTQLTVVSDSMSPIIKTNEHITVSPIAELDSLNVFDIILFEQAGRLNCHFLSKVDYKSNVFHTKSLKNPSSSDYPLESQQIIGIVKDKKIGFFRKIVLILRM